MSNVCPNVLIGIPGSLCSCSREAGHGGECVFDRTPSQEELARWAPTWSTPVPDPTNERIKELESRERKIREAAFGRFLEQAGVDKRDTVDIVAALRINMENGHKRQYEYLKRAQEAEGRIEQLECEVAEWREAVSPFVLASETFRDVFYDDSPVMDCYKDKNLHIRLTYGHFRKLARLLGRKL